MPVFYDLFEIVGYDVLKVLNESLQQGKCLDICRKSVVTPIPKVAKS